MEQKTTKEKILDAALDLFSERGYDGIGVDLIAECAGIKGPSLYRHFNSKEDILSALMEKLDIYYINCFGSESKPGKVPENMDELMEIAREKLEYSMTDPYIRKIRKFLSMEQFHSPHMAQLATSHFTQGVQVVFRQLFQGMMENGSMRKDDPDMVALQFASPVTLILQTYDRQPEKEEEIRERIEKHFEHFIKLYQV